MWCDWTLRRETPDSAKEWWRWILTLYNTLWSVSLHPAESCATFELPRQTSPASDLLWMILLNPFFFQILFATWVVEEYYAAWRMIPSIFGRFQLGHEGQRLRKQWARSRSRHLIFFEALSSTQNEGLNSAKGELCMFYHCCFCR